MPEAQISGAERKARDEERRKEAKTKLAEVNGRRRVEEIFHSPCEYSEFYHMSDLEKVPVLFSPTLDLEDCTKRLTVSPVEQSLLKIIKPGYEVSTDGPGPAKRLRSVSFPYDSQKVLLYVREENEIVFTALLLHSPSMESLITAIDEKYNIPATNIKNIYKQSKKGILVKMDDNILAHYTNESTFVIDLKDVDHDLNGRSIFDITLIEIEANTKS
ncbi:hypothetical protein LSH36_196g06032 [Paralvinella palmiformis]|uniref:GRHL1/CP2 C-terminal domain-containing protein n=1 Tax=Paralvinella palmiformis TaxID=53620 RepID=A0AAD9N4W3_9ANNE|nr:hypothetical protein LSH36_196g06032 [Paralvinella palmiformis]